MEQYLTDSYVANSVLMQRSQHKGCFCIVEGPDDKKLLRPLLDAKSCLLVIAYGRENAEKALAKLECEQDLSVLAITDADFDHLEGRSSPSKNLFRTDTHDFETLILLSPAAFKKLVSEFASDEKARAFGDDSQILDKLLAAATPLGCLRWLSAREKLSLRFKNLQFAPFVVQNAMAIDRSKLFEEVRNHSQRFDLSDSFLSQGIDELLARNPEALQVCCGHDIVEILSVLLRKALGTEKASDVTADRLSSSLRLSYERSAFEKTTLHSSLRKWEADHQPLALFAETERLVASEIA